MRALISLSTRSAMSLSRSDSSMAANAWAASLMEMVENSLMLLPSIFTARVNGLSRAPSQAGQGEQADTRLARARLRDALPGAVGARVVDDEHLESGVLRQDFARRDGRSFGCVGIGEPEHVDQYVGHARSGGSLGTRAAPRLPGSETAYIV